MGDKTGDNILVGNYGEGLACDFLKQRGYKVIKRNYKIGYEEIDIIAEQEDILVFIDRLLKAVQVIQTFLYR